MKNDPPICIAYVFDANYAPHCKSAMLSVIESSCSPLRIHAIASGVDGSVRSTFKGLEVTGKVELNWIDLPPDLLAPFRGRHHISASAFAKLAIPELIADPRIIYLDVDTFVQGDLGELFRTDLGTGLVGAVPDPVGGRSSKVPLADRSAYVNSGVLLMDVQALRAMGFFEACVRSYARWAAEAVWLDQCILNKVLEGNITQLDSRWNRQVFSEKLTLAQWRALAGNADAAVLHFLGDAKPWSGWCSPLIQDLWRPLHCRAHGVDLQSAPAETLQQVYSLGTALHNAERYEEASNVKTQLIRQLAARLREQRPPAQRATGVPGL